MKSMMRNWCWMGALAALMAWPATVQAEESGIQDWGVNDATYGLKTRENEPGFSYTPSPADWRDINIYQLFTDRFADSGDDQLSGYKDSWKCENQSFPANRNFHHGGDWKGMENNIPYLTGMGVKAVWISGVQQNDQGKDTRYTPYHQYHPDNFFKCDPAMGTFEDLKSLIDALHAAGIYVILDVVPNHMCDKNGLWGNSQNDDTYYWPNGNGTFGWWNDGNKHPAPFDTLDYFHNNGTIINWDSHPENKLGQFKGTDDMKTEDSAVSDILTKAFKNLIDATDCDGFRVDAIKHVEYDWIKQWADDMRQHAAYRGKNDFILFGELFVYDNGALASFCKDPGYSFNSALFFPMSQTIKSVFIDNGWTGQLTQTLDAKSQYGEGADRLVTFIDNHDLNRIGLQNGGNYDNNVWDMRPMLSFLYLGTPVPCLYYGTEHAFQQGGHWNGSSPSADNPDDGDWQRECMFDKGFQPGPAQGNRLASTDAPLYQHIAALNAARASYKSLTRGSFQERYQTGGAGAYAFSRVYNDEESLVALNTADGSVSIDPEVGKADGTEFVNVLNTSEKVTVSGGRLSFSLSGKETKVFVAGVSQDDLWVRGTHNTPANGEVTAATPLFVNTEAGPTGVVASAKVGYTADGGTTWDVLAMTETNWSSEGGTWFFKQLGSFPAGTVVEYYIEIEDGSGNKVWDNNNGQNFSVTVEQAEGIWIRGTQNYPVDGDATESTDLWVNSEAGPSGDVTAVSAVVSTDGGTTWETNAMALNAEWGSDGGDWYNVNLGAFAADTVVRYYIEATDGAETVTDDNDGLYYQLTIRQGGNDDFWVGNTTFQPANGEITAADLIQITSESWPQGSATNVGLAYTVDGGATWALEPFANVGSANSNDIWQISKGPYADGTTLRFAVVAQGDGLADVWDNNGGEDFRAIVGDAVEGAAMAEGTPDMSSETFDLVTSGGAVTTSGTNGFGDFGSLYVNYDETNLYIGAMDVALPTDVDNNAYVVFLSGGSTAGAPNVWYVNSVPDGLDRLHNVGFAPAVNIGILLGDIYGDGIHSNFSLYHSEGPEFGQGVFHMPYAEEGSPQTFSGVDGAELIQFDAYGYNDQQAASWKCAIPLSTFGVASADELDNLHLSGVIVSINTNNGANSYLSGKYLGESIEFPNPGEQPDEFGNIATSYVTLNGLPVAMSGGADLGVPESWITDNLGDGYELTEDSNKDGDPWRDREEFFAGLDPDASDMLSIGHFSMDRLEVLKHGGQNVAYIIETADTLDQNGGWNWTVRSTVSRTDGVLSLASNLMTGTSMLMRVKVSVPAPDGPAQRVTVGAAPAGGSFSAASVNVTLSVSGVGVASSTYSIDGAAAVDYTNGTVITVGAGLSVGESTTLDLNGSTSNSTTDAESYTFTKTEEGVQVSWTGNVMTDPAAGAWDEGEALTISFETAPIGAAVAVNLVYNDGSGWTDTPMTQGAPNASNDMWSINLGSGYTAGTTVQFALQALDAEDNSTWNNNDSQDYRVTVNGGSEPGDFTPYSTNPTKGQYRAGGITVDGANTGGEWTTNMLIALDMANDDPRSLGDNWTMHEGPIDFTHLWACWDDNNLYLAYQFVDITDMIDGANAGSALSGKISNNGGHLICISLNTQTGGSTSDMWGKSITWDGSDTPDFQVYMRGDLWDGASYMSTALAGNTWAGDPELGTTYNTFTGWGIAAANGDAYEGGSELWGNGDCDERLDVDAPHRNFLSEGHSTSRDSFYEISIPLSAIGLTRAQLESSGIGVMLSAGSESGMDSIPNDSATTDTPGVESYNSSFEWGDADSYTVPFARIGN